MNEELACDAAAIPYSAVYDGKGGAKLLGTHIPERLNKGDAFFWQNLDYKDPDTFEMLINDYQIARDVAEALCDESTRPRYFRYGDGVVLILRAINHNPGCDPEDMVSVRVWVDKEKIITLSHRRLKIINTMRQMIDKKNNPRTPMQFFLTLAQNMADGINDTVIDITEATADFEEKVLDSNTLGNFHLRDEISDLRRRIISIRRYTAPQKEIFMSLQNEKWDVLTTEDSNDIREIYNDITKVVEDLDYCRDHLTVFQEELQSMTSISMTKIMYMISLVTVIFTPLTMLTGLLGMNVEGIPYAGREYAFAAVCLIMAIIASIVIFLLKKLKWL